jgi:hypothetical protein
MARIVKIRLGEQEVDAIELDFSIKREEWNEYELADGGRVRIKTSVAKIFRVLDSNGKPAFLPDGDPAVVVRHNSEISARSS